MSVGIHFFQRTYYEWNISMRRVLVQNTYFPALVLLMRLHNQCTFVVLLVNVICINFVFKVYICSIHKHIFIVIIIFMLLYYHYCNVIVGILLITGLRICWMAVQKINQSTNSNSMLSLHEDICGYNHRRN